MLATPNTANLTTFHVKTTALFDRLRETQMQTEAGPAHALLDTTLADLVTAVEELNVAGEELRSQQEMIADLDAEREVSQRHYQDLFEFMPDAYIVTDAKSVIREANRAISGLLGVARTYVLGKPLTAFVAREDVESFCAKLARLAGVEGPAVREWSFTLRARKDVTIPVEARTAAVRDGAGQLIGIRWLVRDVSARRAEEARLRLRVAELERLLREQTSELQALSVVQRGLLNQLQSLQGK